VEKKIVESISSITQRFILYLKKKTGQTIYANKWDTINK